jgi:hypothetical protein
MRISLAAAAVLGGVALAFAAAPVQAQRAFPTLRLGQSVQGRLAESDPQLLDRSYFKVYQFRAQPGIRYVATLRSDDFDSYLTLARAVGGITDQIMSDDDGGGDLSSRLRFQVPQAGTYLLIAQAVRTEDEGLPTGAFTIQVDTASVRVARPTGITLGQTVQGELTVDDAEYDSDGYYDLYRFRARAGQRLRIRMEFDTFIPSIAVGTMEDGQFQMLEEDPGNGTLSWTAPEDGEYFVQAGALGSVTGEYTLTVEERRPAPAPRTSPIRRGQTVTGTVEQGDAELDDGRWYDGYAYTGRAGERLRIDASSEDFDAYLVIGRMVDGEFQELQSDDDGGDGTNALLEIELPEDGRYVIQVTSFTEGGGGAYELTVRSR